ncbi:SWI/SNF-related matrix-associated actin-dependent regulator of chromatin subfamily A-like protein 1 [Drosophila sulfurigaster albostrigata]|uniref:SWI/SNF-related matrix-associated actin-dependent regulator of chromatin subfamily A-like protein 1 n=1 Tax=Drosophila sulfurigaster albostrigata TaxID=89887 RepID=UPI002D21DB02|nr:SWI/SNF-related matrix-associated actin-dependent regulator of chromatin subfamily A-like protein 1 [Drosophila sulfurigaster albostrigata]
MSVCSSAEIAEKRRLAIAKLQAKKAASSTTNANEQLSAKSAAKFYNSPPQSNNNKPATSGSLNTNKSSAFLNALKAIKTTSNRELSRASAHPYQRPNGGPSRPSLSLSPEKKDPSGSNLAPVFIKAVTCRIYLISAHRFAVEPSAYHEKLIQVFKMMPTKSYDSHTRIWDFDLKDYQALQQHVGDMKPHVVIGSIPKKVMDLCQQTPKPLERSVLASIAPTLAEKLMPFQEEGVCFAIAQQGRVMICDEMGLGKTYQALAVADYFKDDWPLLICTTASTRDAWARHIAELLPAVPLHYVQVLANNQTYVGEAQVLIASYNMMERHMDKLSQRKFGIVIYDESHTLKNSKAKCTTVAKRLAETAKRVILLSGTPALSRPLELFTQLQLVDSRFMNFIEFTTRYCDGKQTNFGWDANGQSNLHELKIILLLKYMLRRTKAEVLPQLAEKNRETVVLDPALVWTDENAQTTCKDLNSELKSAKGRSREEVLLRFYARTAEVKTRAVCAYLKTLIKEKVKFIIFAHHRVMLDAISDCLTGLKVNYIRIDGQTRSDLRADYVDKFQKQSNCKVAVLSLKACNSGITLTAAEMIVFAELDWNPSTLAQAESRAHRIGQTKPVVCRYLMATQTADDTIWNMLKNKQEVLSKVGIFAENLQKATHTTAPTISHKMEEFFSPAKSEAASPAAGTLKQYFAPATAAKTESNNNVDSAQDIAAFFDEDDDDAFKDLVC